MEAREWLQSTQDYEIGLEILKEAEVSRLSWRLLAKGRSFYNCQRLEKEISALLEPDIPINTANALCFAFKSAGPFKRTKVIS
jgi:hypothetical protein